MSAISIETKKVTELSPITIPEDSYVIPIHDGTNLKNINFSNLKRGISGEWHEVNLSDFADMKTDEAPEMEPYTASIMYNHQSKTVKVHFYNNNISAAYNTGDVLGTIKSAYLPAFEQYGVALFSGNSVNMARPLKITTDGEIIIDSCGNQSVLASILAMDITYVVA